jgi:hypothetical protein
MSLFVQDVFAEAKVRGLTAGFIGTYADLKEALVDLEDYEAEGEAEFDRRYPGVL